MKWLEVTSGGHQISRIRMGYDNNHLLVHLKDSPFHVIVTNLDGKYLGNNPRYDLVSAYPERRIKD